MTVRSFITSVFEEITAADAQGMHYALAALATLALIVRYVFTEHFDAGYATFVIAFWGTAIGNDKLNTPGAK